MDLTVLQRMIGESRLLTAAEKLHWTQSLTHMNPAQITKLEQILTKAAAIPWTQQIQQYINVIAKGQPLISIASGHG